MKKIRMMAVFTVMALAASFAGHAQTTKPTATKTPASKEQAVTPSKQKPATTSSTSTSSTSSATASKPKSGTAHKTHKPATTTAKTEPTAKPKATVTPSNHFARSYSESGMMKGKHKKGHHHAAKKAPSGDGK